MSQNKVSTPAPASASYEAQMSALRQQLGESPYCKEIKNLLPGVTKATIHGAVNGRNKNNLVLSAMRIVVYKHQKAQREAEKNLQAAAQELGVSC